MSQNVTSTIFHQEDISWICQSKKGYLANDFLHITDADILADLNVEIPDLASRKFPLDWHNVSFCRYMGFTRRMATQISGNLHEYSEVARRERKLIFEVAVGIVHHYTKDSKEMYTQDWEGDWNERLQKAGLNERTRSYIMSSTDDWLVKWSLWTWIKFVMQRKWNALEKAHEMSQIHGRNLQLRRYLPKGKEPAFYYKDGVAVPLAGFYGITRPRRPLPIEDELEDELVIDDSDIDEMEIDGSDVDEDSENSIWVNVAGVDLQVFGAPDLLELFGSDNAVQFFGDDNVMEFLFGDSGLPFAEDHEDVEEDEILEDV